MALTTRHSRWLPAPWPYVLNKSGIPLVPLDLVYAFAVPIAEIFYYALADKREAVRRNYARITGRHEHDPVVERMTRQCYRHFGRYVAEFIHVQSWDRDAFNERLEVEGDEHFEEAEAPGRGIIFVSAHMGSTEVAASIVALKGFKITAVTEEIRPRFFMDWAIASRAALGIHLFPTTGSGLTLVRALRKGELVAMVVDAGIDKGGGVAVTFFGHGTTFPVGPARLARLAGAPIVFGLVARRPGGRFIAHICPPILPDPETEAEEDLRRITQELATLFEGFVRRYPTQWYCFRDMWPEGGWPLPEAGGASH